ncbi:hypothetical protein OIU79_019998 [Salix purpurea]|uniref:Uncharacterized protein n=1 Tax=Salix purpurea TaxID=77065 RepID=A0A9Q0P2I9_SALPP|nr:hypothetical protein OIU79_019998 [Salix purpurea]
MLMAVSKEEYLDNRYGGNPATASQKPDLSIHEMNVEERLKERGTDRTPTQGSLYYFFPFRGNGLIAHLLWQLKEGQEFSHHHPWYLMFLTICYQCSHAQEHYISLSKEVVMEHLGQNNLHLSCRCELQT